MFGFSNLHAWLSRKIHRGLLYVADKKWWRLLGYFGFSLYFNNELFKDLVKQAISVDCPQLLEFCLTNPHYRRSFFMLDDYQQCHDQLSSYQKDPSFLEETTFHYDNTNPAQQEMLAIVEHYRKEVYQSFFDHAEQRAFMTKRIQRCNTLRNFFDLLRSERWLLSYEEYEAMLFSATDEKNIRFLYSIDFTEWDDYLKISSGFSLKDTFIRLLRSDYETYINPIPFQMPHFTQAFMGEKYSRQHSDFYNSYMKFGNQTFALQRGVLGTGGTAVVKVLKSNNDEVSVVKIVKKTTSSSRQPIIQNEISVLEKLGRLLGVTERKTPNKRNVASKYYIRMKYIEGKDLLDWLYDGNRLKKKLIPLSIRIELGLAIINALIELHRNNIFHGDIKPENFHIVYEPHNNKYLAQCLDFGFSKIMSPNHTMKGSSKGTPLYAAPELFCEPAYYNHASDVYSLGIILLDDLQLPLPHEVFDRLFCAAPKKRMTLWELHNAVNSLVNQPNAINNQSYKLERPWQYLHGYRL